MHFEWPADHLKCHLVIYDARWPLGPAIAVKHMQMSGAYMQDEAPAAVCLTQSQWIVCIVNAP